MTEEDRADLAKVCELPWTNTVEILSLIFVFGLQTHCHLVLTIISILSILSIATLVAPEGIRQGITSSKFPSTDIVPGRSHNGLRGAAVPHSATTTAVSEFASSAALRSGTAAGQQQPNTGCPPSRLAARPKRKAGTRSGLGASLGPGCSPGFYRFRHRVMLFILPKSRNLGNPAHLASPTSSKSTIGCLRFCPPANLRVLLLFWAPPTPEWPGEALGGPPLWILFGCRVRQIICDVDGPQARGVTSGCDVKHGVRCGTGGPAPPCRGRHVRISPLDPLGDC